MSMFASFFSSATRAYGMSSAPSTSPGLQLQDTGGVIGDDWGNRPHRDRQGLSVLAHLPIVGVALDHHLGAALPAIEHEGSGANRMLGEGFSALSSSVAPAVASNCFIRRRMPG